MPLPALFVNSVRSMPILLMSVCIGSHPPVRAMSGIEVPAFAPPNSFLLRGKRSRLSGDIGFGIGLFVHCTTFGIMYLRRHLPAWMTIGMFVPTGTFFRVKFPLGSVSAVTIGFPEMLAPPQESQIGPWGIGSSAAPGEFGT